MDSGIFLLFSFFFSAYVDASGGVNSEITVREGEPAVLSCSFLVGGKNAKVVWRKGSEVLSVDHRIVSTENRYRIESRYEGDFNLHIEDTRPEDSGEYKCVSTVQGTQASDITLKVTPHREKEDINKLPSNMSPACYKDWHLVPGPDAVCVRLYLDRERSRKSASRKCSLEGGSLISPSSETGLEYIQGLVLSQSKEKRLRKAEIWTAGRMSKRKNWQWDNGEALSIGTWYHQSLGAKKAGRTMGLYCSVARGRCGWIPRRRRSRLYIACQMDMSAGDSRIRTRAPVVAADTSSTLSSTTSGTTSTTTSSTTSFTTSTTTSLSPTTSSISSTTTSPTTPRFEALETDENLSTENTDVEKGGKRRNKKKNKCKRRKKCRRKNRKREGTVVWKTTE